MFAPLPGQMASQCRLKITSCCLGGFNQKILCTRKPPRKIRVLRMVPNSETQGRSWICPKQPPSLGQASNAKSPPTKIIKKNWNHKEPKTSRLTCIFAAFKCLEKKLIKSLIKRPRLVKRKKHLKLWICLRTKKSKQSPLKALKKGKKTPEKQHN